MRSRYSLAAISGIVALGAFVIFSSPEREAPGQAREFAPKAISVKLEELKVNHASVRRELRKLGDAILAVRLDEAEARESLNDATRSLTQAQAHHQTAELARNAAEAELREYVEVEFKQQLAAIESDIVNSKAALKQAKDYLDWAEKMIARGAISRSEHTASRLAFTRCTLQLEQDLARKDFLLRSERGQREQALKLKLEAMTASANATLADVEVARAKADRARDRLPGRSMRADEVQVLLKLDAGVAAWLDAGAAISKVAEHAETPGADLGEESDRIAKLVDLARAAANEAAELNRAAAAEREAADDLDRLLEIRRAAGKLRPDK